MRAVGKAGSVALQSAPGAASLLQGAVPQDTGSFQKLFCVQLPKTIEAGSAAVPVQPGEPTKEAIPAVGQGIVLNKVVDGAKALARFNPKAFKENAAPSVSDLAPDEKGHALGPKSIEAKFIELKSVEPKKNRGERKHLSVVNKGVPVTSAHPSADAAGSQDSQGVPSQPVHRLPDAFSEQTEPPNAETKPQMVPQAFPKVVPQTASPAATAQRVGLKHGDTAVRQEGKKSVEVETAPDDEEAPKAVVTPKKFECLMEPSEKLMPGSERSMPQVVAGITFAEIAKPHILSTGSFHAVPAASGANLVRSHALDAMDSAPMLMTSETHPSHGDTRRVELQVGDTVHGALRLQASMEKDGSVHVTAVAATAGSYLSLEQGLSQMRDFLVKEHVHIDSLDVAGPPSSSTSGATDSGSRQHEQHNREETKTVDWNDLSDAGEARKLLPLELPVLPAHSSGWISIHA